MPSHPFQLSMRQLAVVVLYGAVGAFAVTPLAQIAQVESVGSSLAMTLVVGTIIVLLTWALMLRLTPARTRKHVWLSNLCLAFPLGLLAIGLPVLSVWTLVSGARTWPLPLPRLGLILGLTPAADALLVILVRRLWLAPCPACRRRGLVADSRRRSGLEKPLRILWPIATCLHCGTRARRLAGGWTVEADVIDHLRRNAPSIGCRPDAAQPAVPVA